MQLKIIPHEETVFTIQKGCLSQWTVFGEKHPDHGVRDGRFALVQILEHAFCVCKLFWRRQVHPSFVYLDLSVIHFKSSGDENCGMPRTSLTNTDGFIQNRNIQLLPEVVPVKKISLTVLMENITDVPKWRKDKSTLEEIVSEILKMYIVTRDSVVFLKNLKEGLRHEIFGLVIHSCGPSSIDISPGQVTSQTDVSIIRIISKLRFQQSLERGSVSKLGGLEEPAGFLRDIVKANIRYKNCHPEFPLKPTRQLLLTGPSGCGKTSLVKQIAAECDATLLTVLGPETVSPKPGASEEALRKVFQEATILAEEHEKGVCILLLDEVDSICPRRESSESSSHSVRTTVQLLSLLEEADKTPGLLVIGTTNKANCLDPSVRRPGRLETEVFVNIPSQPQRKKILEVLLKDIHLYLCEPDVLAQYIASITPGYSGADLALICQHVTLENFQSIKNEIPPLEQEKLSKFWATAFKKAVSKIKPSGLRSGLGVVLTTPTSMDCIGGLESIKNELRVAIEWPLTHPDAFNRMGLPHPKGVLLYGPPGCAKTSIARALASATNTTFLAVSAADLFSPYVGEAERTVADLFHRARSSSPTILFIDEIDALVGSRGDRGAAAQERVLSAFLTEMDGIGLHFEGLKLDDDEKQLLEGGPSDLIVSSEVSSKKGKVSGAGVIVIAATNRPDMIDSALLRPGRFDKLLYVPAPDPEDRYKILQSVSKNMPLDDSVDFKYLVEATHLFSGADLSNLCKEAALYALSQDGMSVAKINYDHFEAALRSMNPSLNINQIKWYEEFKNNLFR